MGEKTPVEERFRYIGFEVFPKEAKPLFESLEEEKKYLEKIRKRKFKFFFLEREHSLIELPVLTKFERALIAVCSFLVLASFLAFPVGKVYLQGVGDISVSGLSFLLNLSELSTFLGLVDTRATIVAGLMAAFLILGAAIGLFQLLSILRSFKSERSKSVALANRLGWLPVLCWIAALAVSFSGFPTPAWSLLGVEELGKSFNALRLLSIAGWGLWVMLAALLINGSIPAE